MAFHHDMATFTLMNVLILADAFLENGGTLTFDDSEVSFKDSSALDWFLVVWPFQKYFLCDVVVSIEFDYFLSNTSLFYINEAGGKDILVLNSSGDKVAGEAELIESRCSLDSRAGCKSFRITIRYSCNHPTFRVGLYSAHGYHQGSGYNKLIITSIF